MPSARLPLRAAILALVVALAAAPPLPLAPAAAFVQPPATPAPPPCNDGRRRWLEVRNIHPQAIYFVQSRRPYGGDQWGQDALGQTLIPSSSFIYVGMPSAGCQCAADLRITFEAERGGAGHAVEYRNIAYCSRAGESLPRLIVDN